MSGLDDRARRAVGEVHSLFTDTPIPEPPGVRTAPRRWMLAGMVVTTVSVFGGGLYLASRSGGELPTADTAEPQSTEPRPTTAQERHYGIEDLPDGWRRNVVDPTGPGVLTGDRIVIVGLGSTATVSSHVFDSGFIGNDFSVETIGGRSVRVYTPRPRLEWDDDRTTVVVASPSLDTARRVIAGLVRDGDDYIPRSRADGIVLYRGDSRAVRAMFSPTLSSAPLLAEGDELTTFAAPDGQTGVSLAVTRGVDESVQVLLSTSGAENGMAEVPAPAIDQGTVVYSGVTTTSAMPSTMRTVSWLDRSDLITATGLGLTGEAFAAFVGAVGRVDDATWQRWVDASVKLAPANPSAEPAVPVSPPPDANGDTLNFFVDTAGTPFMSLVKFPVDDSGTMREMLCDPRSPTWPNPTTSDCLDITFTTPPVSDPLWWAVGQTGNDWLVGVIRDPRVRSVNVSGDTSWLAFVPEVDPLDNGEAVAWRLAADSVPGGETLTIDAKDANGERLWSSTVPRPSRP